MTPDEMRTYLGRKIVAQRADMDRAGRYYAGQQPMQWIDPMIAQTLCTKVALLNVIWPDWRSTPWPRGFA
jgi:hypothetical protein